MSFIESKLKFVLIIFAFLSTASGGVFWVDGRYAKADEQVELEKRVSIQELNQQLRVAVDEYYFLKQQLRKYPDDADLKEKVDEAKAFVDGIKQQIKDKKELKPI